MFQKSVVNNKFDTKMREDANAAFVKFNTVFNPEKIAEIRLLKEEEYQDGFLRDLFVTVLGYTLRPDPNFNLVREKKNSTDGKKSDGAIINGEKVLAVIELKSTKTKDLNTITNQAFNYKNNQADCRYVITSNFQYLRFYIDNATEFVEFNLFQLEIEQFNLLFLLLSPRTFFADMPLQLKLQTAIHEKEITNKLYKDYKEFQEVLFTDICNYNKKFDKLTLFKKTQKLLDRLLFVFFAEDVGLIPPNAIHLMLRQWEIMNEECDEKVSFYSRLQKLFGHLDKGHKYKKWGLIPAYNGGLFRKDEILDAPNFIISDGVLQTHCLRISAYDFGSEVDVNILGHIFEHSMGEVEEIAAELEGTTIEKDKTRRKKDGVFYTPRYITRYIVDATLGKICAEKKITFGLDNIVLDEVENKKQKNTLLANLEAYKSFLFGLKILDPACGSGAFLNQTLDFLIAEHQYIQKLIADIKGNKIAESNDDKQILEQNIFGVDINDESVEIAKLSLWLRTAKKGRLLSDLNNNIKCGNSLIDNPEIAGDKAFDWNAEFPEIMQNGGFDVVLGNPPYVVINKLNTMTAQYKWHTDLYLMFFEQCFNKLLKKDKGLLGFITPRYWLINKVNKDFREFLLNNVNIWLLAETTPFEDANVECVVSILQNSESKSDVIPIFEEVKEVFTLVNTIEKSYCFLNDNNEILTFLTKEEIVILSKMEQNSTQINQIVTSKRGMEISKNDLRNQPNGIATLIGQDVAPYSIIFEKTYVNNTVKDYLRLQNFFSDNLIYLRRVANRLIATKSNKIYAYNKNLYGLKIKLDTFQPNYILALLNSKLLDFYYKKKFSLKKVDIFPEIQTYLFEALPIKNISLEAQQPFIDKANLMLDLNEQLVDKIDTFLGVVAATWRITQNNVLLSFYQLDTNAFFAELEKQKIKILPSDKPEWIKYFNTSCAEINAIRQTIADTDAQINRMVYALYGLTAEEIASIGQD